MATLLPVALRAVALSVEQLMCAPAPQPLPPPTTTITHMRTHTPSMAASVVVVCVKIIRLQPQLHSNTNFPILQNSQHESQRKATLRRQQQQQQQRTRNSTTSWKIAKLLATCHKDFRYPRAITGTNCSAACTPSTPNNSKSTAKSSCNSNVLTPTIIITTTTTTLHSTKI